jgi:urease accessory protein
MDSLSFIHGLQLADSFFPVGAFAYSDGLETAASAGLVHDATSLAGWMDHFIENTFVPCEGRALVRTIRALDTGDTNAISTLDQELTAIKPSSSVRASSTGVGKRLLSLYGSISGDENFSAISRQLLQANAAVAYGLVYWHRRIPEREAALAFGYNKLAGIVSAALRLISIGHQQGQTLLTSSLDRLPDAVERTLQSADEPLRSFSPILDIQQMNHQYVYSRLFRS